VVSNPDAMLGKNKEENIYNEEEEYARRE